MDDTSPNSRKRTSDTTSVATPSSEKGTPQRHGMLDLAALITLLGLVASVYVIVGDVGFSVITSAVAGLFGTWRARR